MRIFLSTLIALALPYAALAKDTAQTHPVVIELFTSQGCSSCPAADKIVGEYADSANVLPLSFHVTYWNYIGWDDPYSKEGFTKRQHEYKNHLGRFNVYTPQAVVQGQHDIVGSNRYDLQKAVQKAALSQPWVQISIQTQGDDISISIPESTTTQARVLLVGFQKIVRNAVTSGENAGRKLAHRNSVVELIHIADYKGSTLNNRHRKPAGDGIAVLLQSTKDGRIIGASWK